MGYFFNFKMQFQWEDREKGTISCIAALKDERSTKSPEINIIIDIKDNKIKFLNDAKFNIKILEDEFKTFIINAANRWAKKQSSE